MVGTMLNAGAILAGVLAGLWIAKDFSYATQSRIKTGLGAFCVYAGFSVTWTGLNGSFGQIASQLMVVLLALILGNLAGKGLRLQRLSNRLGQYAKERCSLKLDPAERPSNDGFITCAILFCVSPMSFLGAFQEGLTGDFKTLAIKSIMDGLAAKAFVATFGWSVALSAIPVVAYQGTVTLAATALEPVLRDRALMDSVNATGGLLICCLALIVLGLKRVHLADYLPSLVFAPFLTWLWR